MNRIGVAIVVALVASACSQGPTADEIQEQIDDSINAALATTTTTTPTTTTTFPTTTTTSPTVTTTTLALPEFPDALSELSGTVWAVVLAVSEGFRDPALSTAVIAAQDAGYQAGVGDAGCDPGLLEAVGLTEGNFYNSVSVYFATEDEANQARDAFAARGVGGTVAEITPICND